MTIKLFDQLFSKCILKKGPECDDVDSGIGLVIIVIGIAVLIGKILNLI